MFELFKITRILTRGRLRLGAYGREGGKVLTPCYFFISNLGGGGTNVSRLISYLDVFEAGDSQLLLNYYYLKLRAFDGDIISTLGENESFVEFLKRARKFFIEKKGRAVPGHASKETTWAPEVLLDSGSGNVFRDLTKHTRLTEASFQLTFEQVIKEYIEFGAKHKCNILISFDIAEKNTQKQGEHEDETYNRLIDKFNTMQNNINLLKCALKHIPHKRDFMVFAPIHGKEATEYARFLTEVLSLESKEGKQFDGFAIGGLGRFRNRKTIYAICHAIRNELDQKKDTRPVHILAVGAVQNLIPLTLLGMDSFDCHSPWRRASEGGCFITPLVDSKGHVIAKNAGYWKYLPIQKYAAEANFGCDCDVCKKYDIDKLVEMYEKGSNEQKYFAKILFFKHNISQQEFILRRVRNGDIVKLIEEMPDNRDKKVLREFLDTYII